MMRKSPLETFSFFRVPRTNNICGTSVILRWLYPSDSDCVSTDHKLFKLWVLTHPASCSTGHRHPPLKRGRGTPRQVAWVGALALRTTAASPISAKDGRQKRWATAHPTVCATSELRLNSNCHATHAKSELIDSPKCILFMDSPRSGPTDSRLIFADLVPSRSGTVFVTTSSSIGDFSIRSIAGPESTA